MHLVLAVPGDPETPTGGYVYDRRMAEALAARGLRVDWLRLPDGFPDPAPEETETALAALAEAPEDALVVIDGLACGALPAGRLAGLGRPFVALVHHPLAHETGLSPERARMLAESERAALAEAACVLVTSPSTARLLAESFAVPEAAITVAEPGTDPAPRARGSADGTVTLACLGALIPRKGQDLLIAALAGIADRPWHCRIAGADDRDPAFAARVAGQVAASGLGGRIELLGALDSRRRDGLLHDADLFVLPSRFEGYGMVFAEALSRGLPIVAFAAGAVPDVVPEEAGILVPLEDVGALTRALARMIDEPDARAAMAEAAWRAGQALPSWADGAARIEAALRRIAR